MGRHSRELVKVVTNGAPPEADLIQVLMTPFVDGPADNPLISAVRYIYCIRWRGNL
jgi:hypothetical protein